MARSSADMEMWMSKLEGLPEDRKKAIIELAESCGIVFNSQTLDNPSEVISESELETDEDEDNEETDSVEAVEVDSDDTGDISLVGQSRYGSGDEARPVDVSSDESDEDDEDETMEERRQRISEEFTAKYKNGYKLDVSSTIIGFSVQRSVYNQGNRGENSTDDLIKLPRVKKSTVKRYADQLIYNEELLFTQASLNYWPACRIIKKEERYKETKILGGGVRAAKDIPAGAVATNYAGPKLCLKRFFNNRKYPEITKKYMLEHENKIIFGHILADRKSLNVEDNREAPFYGCQIQRSPHANCEIKWIKMSPKTRKELLHTVIYDHEMDYMGKPEMTEMAVVVAKRDIKAGEELLLDSGSDNSRPSSVCPCLRCLGKCHCKKCRGIHFHPRPGHEDIDLKRAVKHFLRKNETMRAFVRIVYFKTSSMDLFEWVLLELQGWKEEKWSTEKKTQAKDKVIMQLKKLADIIQKSHDSEKPKRKIETAFRFRLYRRAVEALKWELPESSKGLIRELFYILRFIKNPEMKMKILEPFFRNAVILCRMGEKWWGTVVFHKDEASNKKRERLDKGLITVVLKSGQWNETRGQQDEPDSFGIVKSSRDSLNWWKAAIPEKKRYAEKDWQFRWADAEE